MQPLSDQTFRGFTELMYSVIGVSFTDGKLPLVSSRLAPRIQRMGLASFEEYLALISGDADAGEFQVAVDLLTTNETYFFREPEHFAHLERELASVPSGELKIWSAASSFGDEAYSIAMLLSDLQQLGRIGSHWSVLGTDISDRVLRSAVEAIYPQERLRHVSAQRLKRYCLQGEGDAAGFVKMRPCLTERVRFGQLNLCRNIEQLGPFDAVFLRNVLIYFDGPTKAEVVDRVLEHLRPNGLFFIGTAEGRVKCRTPLTTLAPGVFRKIAP
jgi:chemotaxis protein methyltransferase CheR